jgi:hypothetical protein
MASSEQDQPEWCFRTCSTVCGNALRDQESPPCTEDRMKSREAAITHQQPRAMSLSSSPSAQCV